MTASTPQTTRAMRVRDEAQRILDAADPMRVMAARLVHTQMLIDEALTRITHLEAILRTTEDRSWPPAATGAGQRGAKP